MPKVASSLPLATPQNARYSVGVSPMTGEELQKLVADVSNLSPALLEKVRAAYTTTKTN